MQRQIHPLVGEPACMLRAFFMPCCNNIRFCTPVPGVNAPDASWMVFVNGTGRTVLFILPKQTIQAMTAASNNCLNVKNSTVPATSIDAIEKNLHNIQMYLIFAPSNQTNLIIKKSAYLYYLLLNRKKYEYGNSENTQGRNNAL